MALQSTLHTCVNEANHNHKWTSGLVGQRETKKVGIVKKREAKKREHSSAVSGGVHRFTGHLFRLACHSIQHETTEKILSRKDVAVYFNAYSIILNINLSKLECASRRTSLVFLPFLLSFCSLFPSAQLFLNHKWRGAAKR